jgi:uncharacterized protein (DUF934 family)
MSALICDGKVADDRWQWIEGEVPRVAERLEAGEQLVLPLAVWLAHRARLDPQRAGVWLGPDDALEALLPWLAGVPLVAIHFPLFTDGRGYSLAHLLRRRHGYTGELRAVGDVLVDQLALMAQCGFDSFRLRADQPPAAALAALAGGLRSPWPGTAMP